MEETTIEAYTIRDYRYTRESRKDLLQDGYALNRFMEYDFVVIDDDDFTFTINTRKIVHIVISSNHIEIKTDTETIYINQEGIRVVP